MTQIFTKNPFAWSLYAEMPTYARSKSLRQSNECSPDGLSKYPLKERGSAKRLHDLRIKVEIFDKTNAIGR